LENESQSLVMKTPSKEVALVSPSSKVEVLIKKATNRKSLKWWHSLLIGALCGALAVLMDFFPNNSFWFLSFASGTFGIWGFASIIIMHFSNKAKSAGRNVLFFLMGMSLTYYLIKGSRDTFTSIKSLQELQAQGIDTTGLSWLSFNWGMLIFWCIVSVVCGIGIYLIFKLRAKKIIYAVLTSIPLAVILTEGIHFSIQLFTIHQGFVPCVVDIACFIISFILLNDENKKKLWAIPFIIIFTTSFLLLRLP